MSNTSEYIQKKHCELYLCAFKLFLGWTLFGGLSICFAFAVGCQIGFEFELGFASKIENIKIKNGVLGPVSLKSKCAT